MWKAIRYACAALAIAYPSAAMCGPARIVLNKWRLIQPEPVTFNVYKGAGFKSVIVSDAAGRRDVTADFSKRMPPYSLPIQSAGTTVLAVDLKPEKLVLKSNEVRDLLTEFGFANLAAVRTSSGLDRKSAVFTISYHMKAAVQVGDTISNNFYDFLGQDLEFSAINDVYKPYNYFTSHFYDMGCQASYLGKPFNDARIFITPLFLGDGLGPSFPGIPTPSPSKAYHGLPDGGVLCQMAHVSTNDNIHYYFDYASMSYGRGNKPD